jgi:hypothetical protein
LAGNATRGAGEHDGRKAHAVERLGSHQQRPEIDARVSEGWSSSEQSAPLLAESVREEFGLEREREEPTPARARRVRSVHPQTDHRGPTYVVGAVDER